MPHYITKESESTLNLIPFLQTYRGMTLTSSNISPTAGVMVIIGSGGIGLATARRMGSGYHVVLADFSQKQLDTSTNVLREEGQIVEAIQTDISNLDSVNNLAQRASQLGPIRAVVHNAGLSPIQAPADRIYEVNTLGVAQTIDAFLPLVIKGTTMVVIASLAGHSVSGSISPEFERHLATAPTKELLMRPEFDTSSHETEQNEKSYGERSKAYSISKWANVVRVQAAAQAWASKGGRINSVSPGVIATPMTQQEKDSPLGGQALQQIIDASPVKRAGGPTEIANVIAFLSSQEASFITGNDILVDGGINSSARWAGA